jgi:hypothetical protein
MRKTLTSKDLECAYQQMAEEETRETDALDWAEAIAEDVADEASLRSMRPLAPTR